LADTPDHTLLLRTFADEQVNLALELFLRMITGELGIDLVSVILYGSITFGDLAPGYGDLDFLAVVRGEPSEDRCRRLIELRRPLRSGEHGIIATMIEGPFMPRAMLPAAGPGRAVWWGTSGERTWNRNELGVVVLYVIREHGIVIWGEDLRAEIPEYSPAEVFADLRHGVRMMQGIPWEPDVHAVEGLFLSARTLLWLREGRTSGKSEAAAWAAENAAGRWRDLLPRAIDIRRNPELAERADVKAWLAELAGPTREALAEADAALAARLAEPSP